MKLSKLIELLEEKKNELDYDPTVTVYEPYSDLHERPVTYIQMEDGNILISCE